MTALVTPYIPALPGQKAERQAAPRPLPATDRAHSGHTNLPAASFADDAVIVNKAISWLEENQSDPFFLMLFLTAPHSKYDPPEGFRPFFKDDLPKGRVMQILRREYRDLPPSGDIEWTKAAYDGEILYADVQMGKLIAHLEKAGMMEEVTIAVTADHGEIFGEHNCFLHAHHMWEQVLRVPFLISSPAFPQGVYDDRPFTHLDIAPTLLEFVGIEASDLKKHGKSIIEVLADPFAGRERVIFSQCNAHGIRRESIRKGRYKLVHHHPVDHTAVEQINDFHADRSPLSPEDLPTLSWDEEKWELYDLVEDPKEQNNLFEKLKDAPQTLELLKQLADSMDDDNLTIEIDKDLRKALEETGYIVKQKQ